MSTTATGDCAAPTWCIDVYAAGTAIIHDSMHKSLPMSIAGALTKVRMANAIFLPPVHAGILNTFLLQ
jgi:hypothetical protein